MRLSRFFLSILALSGTAAGPVFAQGTATQPIYAQPVPQYSTQQYSVLQYPNQPTAPQQPARQPPIQMQTLQTPPKTVLHNGVTVYQQGQPATATAPAATTSDRTMPPGYGSPYPTGLQPNQGVYVATTQTDPNRQPGSVYGLPPQNTPASQPAVGQPPIAAAHTGMPVTAQPQRTLVGRSEPQFRVVPFVLDAREQQELDEFLVRWEKYSDTIKRYEVDFTAYVYDPTVPQDDPKKPYKIPFGYFKFIKPNQFVYHLEGEWKNGVQVKRSKDDPKTSGINEEKIIINEKAFFQYDYVAETVMQINIPPDKVGLGIADSPLPLIFGAKADDMKKRFFMKLVTREDKKDTEIWLQARPRMIEDQQEFREVEIRLDKKTMRATAIKKDDINGKAHTVYVLSNPKINSGRGLLDDIVKLFVPEIPRGWKHKVETMPEAGMQAGGPANVPAAPQPAVAGPPPAVPPAGNEIPLYTPQK